MSKKGVTDIIFVIDSSLFDCEIKVNKIIEEQKKHIGSARISLYTFGSYVRRKFLREDVSKMKEVSGIAEKESGLVRLYDGIGTGIDDMGVVFKSLPAEARPKHVLFIIVANRDESGSTEYSERKLRGMVERQVDGYKWEFLFVGENSVNVGDSVSFLEVAREGDFFGDLSFLIRRFRDLGVLWE